MTWPASEGHANPFPESESMSQQRPTEVVTSTRPLRNVFRSFIRSGVGEKCMGWQKKGRKKKPLSTTSLQNDLKGKSASCEECERIKASNL